jgi:aspartokinase-like uncharacterized kinase
MWVVKMGGSLVDGAELRPWLDVLAGFGGGRVVIVPGGGPFADQVRRAQDLWGFDNKVAHRMAILGMEQYGLMMTGIRPDLRLATSRLELRQMLREAAVPVWLPAAMTFDNPEIPESWEITSDSLAAWLAETMGAEMLILVKSIEPIKGAVTAHDLSERGIADPLFPFLNGAGRYESRLMSRSEHKLMERMLVTGMPGGIVIGKRRPEPVAVPTPGYSRH